LKKCGHQEPAEDKSQCEGAAKICCAKAAWARLIRKVCEADPLECPQCRKEQD